ncbi:MAG: Imm74 family immunity protein [Acinetobacter sp.]
MKIIKTTPYAIIVERDGWHIKIAGETFVRGYGSPDFIIYLNSIKRWEREEKEIPISEEERNMVVSFVLAELRSKRWLIEVE